MGELGKSRKLPPLRRDEEPVCRATKLEFEVELEGVGEGDLGVLDPFRFSLGLGVEGALRTDVATALAFEEAFDLDLGRVPLLFVITVLFFAELEPRRSTLTFLPVFVVVDGLRCFCSVSPSAAAASPLWLPLLWSRPKGLFGLLQRLLPPRLFPLLLHFPPSPASSSSPCLETDAGAGVSLG